MSSTPKHAGVAQFGGVAFPGKGRITGMIQANVTIDPPSIAAGAKTSVTGTFAGATTDCAVIAIVPPAALEAGLVPIAARVSATDTIQIDLYNPTAVPIDGASRVWAVTLICP